MDEATGGRPRRQRSSSVLSRLGLTISRSAGGVVPARVMAGIQASLLLLLLVGCATPDWGDTTRWSAASRTLWRRTPSGPQRSAGR
jgi:hypothetical protein